MAISIIKTKRLQAKKLANKFVIKNPIRNIILKNRSHTDINVWFDSERVEDSYVLERNETTPPIKVQENTIHYSVAEGEGEANFIILMWE